MGGRCPGVVAVARGPASGGAPVGGPRGWAEEEAVVGPSEGTQRGCGDAASRAHGPAAGPADGLVIASKGKTGRKGI